jgi:hypothetical protein
MNKPGPIALVRKARIAISKEHGNDPRKLVAYYMKKQAKQTRRRSGAATVSSSI